MKTVYVNLPVPSRVQQFVNVLTGLEGDFELVSGKHILDARSLMGIFSFDLSEPLELRIYQDTEEIMQVIQPFLAGEEDNDHE